MRGIILIFAALAFATAAGAAKPAQGPYTVDRDGRCRAGNGSLVAPRLCHVPGYCEDLRTGRFVKCPVGCSLESLSRCHGLKPIN